MSKDEVKLGVLVAEAILDKQENKKKLKKVASWEAFPELPVWRM